MLLFLFAEPYSDKELFEAQDTILFHLSNCAELNFTEKDVIGHLRVSSD